MNETMTRVPGVKVGHATDEKNGTGCTVVRVEEGAVGGVVVRGGAPGTRETDLLDPSNLVERVHSVVLSGGSAYGLDSATGVMRYLEEHGYGLDVGVARVPIVPAAVLFDLAYKNAAVRPDARMGYEAAAQATDEPVEEGSVGAGTGATVGKLLGPDGASKGGLGSYAVDLGDGIVVGAIVAVNAVGEVRNPETNEWLAGTRDPKTNEVIDSRAYLLAHGTGHALAGANTTIGVVATNARLTKAEAKKVASLAHNAFATTIHPAHTMMDGDTIFVLSTGDEETSVDRVGNGAVRAMERAIVRAVRAGTKSDEKRP